MPLFIPYRKLTPSYPVQLLYANLRQEILTALCSPLVNIGKRVCVCVCVCVVYAYNVLLPLCIVKTCS